MSETATEDPAAAYKAFTASIIDDFRAHHGAPTEGPLAGRQILLLTTTGARTGQARVSPMVFSRDGDDYVVAASKGGAPTHPGWYANIEADPVVTVEVGGETFQARAVAIDGGPERDRLYAQHAKVEAGFLDYPKKTDRVIPVVRLVRTV